MLQVGMLVDRKYKILSIIGRGGTSCVFLAENIRLKNRWAIKEIYKNQFSGIGTDSNGLIAETSILTKLRHPGLPSIIDILETDQSYLIVMEYIEGISLDKLISQQGAQPENLVRNWIAQLCDVLQYLHNCNPAIIHRDIKPANIILRLDGSIVLIDFGIAREYKRNSLRDTSNMGTHGYAAPEQVIGSVQTDARTDIYSLGVTIYHLITGVDPCVPPYGIRHIKSINPSLSSQMDTFISKSTQIEPFQRYQSVEEIFQYFSGENANHVYFPMEDSEQRSGSQGWIAAVIAVPIALLFIIIIAVVAFSLGNSPNVGADIITTAHYEDRYEYLESVNYVDIQSENQRYYYEFTPSETGKYLFTSETGNGAAVIWIYDEDLECIYEDNADGYSYNFYLEAFLLAGETYYVETTLYNRLTIEPEVGQYKFYVDYYFGY